MDMEKVKGFWRICIEDGALAGWLCLIVSLVLIIASFIIPPAGVIDSSVLAGVGELMAFAVIFKLPNMVQSIKDGKSLTVKHGETEVTVTSEKEEN